MHHQHVLCATPSHLLQHSSGYFCKTKNPGSSRFEGSVTIDTTSVSIASMSSSCNSLIYIQPPHAIVDDQYIIIYPDRHPPTNQRQQELWPGADSDEILSYYPVIHHNHHNKFLCPGNKESQNPPPITLHLRLASFINCCSSASCFSLITTVADFAVLAASFAAFAAP